MIIKIYIFGEIFFSFSILWRIIGFFSTIKNNLRLYFKEMNVQKEKLENKYDELNINRAINENIFDRKNIIFSLDNKFR